MTFKEAYKFPLNRPRFSKVFTANYDSAFDFMFPLMASMFPNPFIITDERKDDIVTILNGEKKGKLVDIVLTRHPTDSLILANGQPFILVRGWGHLTGRGGLNLPVEDATELQNDFIDYIINTLT